MKSFALFLLLLVLPATVVSATPATTSVCYGDLAFRTLGSDSPTCNGSSFSSAPSASVLCGASDTAQFIPLTVYRAPHDPLSMVVSLLIIASPSDIASFNIVDEFAFTVRDNLPALCPPASDPDPWNTEADLAGQGSHGTVIGDELQFRSADVAALYSAACLSSVQQDLEFDNTLPGTKVSYGSTYPAVCDASEWASGGAVSVAFTFECPDVDQTHTSTTAYLYAKTTANSAVWAGFQINCTFDENPIRPSCRTYEWCTPPIGEPFGNTCGATDDAVVQDVLDVCETASYGGWSCDVTVSTCTNCADGLWGQKDNTLTVCSVDDTGVDAVTAAVHLGAFETVTRRRATSYNGIPQWATVLDGSGNVIPCPTCPVPPPSSELARSTMSTIRACADLDSAELLVWLATPLPVFSPNGTALTVLRDGVESPVCTTAARSGSSRQTAQSAVWGGAIGCTTVSCCDQFYLYALCNWDLSAASVVCTCGAINTYVCPTTTCEESKKGLLGLLALLLLIPLLLLLILLSVLIFCCWKKKKGGWEERQLATFDPQPEPAAPPPPVNVYEDHHHHSDVVVHDGYSGYAGSSGSHHASPPPPPGSSFPHHH